MKRTRGPGDNGCTVTTTWGLQWPGWERLVGSVGLERPWAQLQAAVLIPLQVPVDRRASPSPKREDTEATGGRGKKVQWPACALRPQGSEGLKGSLSLMEPWQLQVGGPNTGQHISLLTLGPTQLQGWKELGGWEEWAGCISQGLSAGTFSLLCLSLSPPWFVPSMRLKAICNYFVC